ncbi:hypothetical protein HDU76_011009 [Blyttiomyces sp. JEL0837]|nr:hypothetical protein HDU76_011009 [Blyttiomyces sp. JEL0837]
MSTKTSTISTSPRRQVISTAAQPKVQTTTAMKAAPSTITKLTGHTSTIVNVNIQAQHKTSTTRMTTKLTSLQRQVTPTLAKSKVQTTNPTKSNPSSNKLVYTKFTTSMSTVKNVNVQAPRKTSTQSTVTLFAKATKLNSSRHQATSALINTSKLKATTGAKSTSTSTGKASTSAIKFVNVQAPQRSSTKTTSMAKVPARFTASSIKSSRVQTTTTAKSHGPVSSKQIYSKLTAKSSTSAYRRSSIQAPQASSAKMKTTSKLMTTKIPSKTTPKLLQTTLSKKISTKSIEETSTKKRSDVKSSTTSSSNFLGLSKVTAVLKETTTQTIPRMQSTAKPLYTSNSLRWTTRKPSTSRARAPSITSKKTSGKMTTRRTSTVTRKKSTTKNDGLLGLAGITKPPMPKSTTMARRRPLLERFTNHHWYLYRTSKRVKCKTNRINPTTNSSELEIEVVDRPGNAVAIVNHLLTLTLIPLRIQSLSECAPSLFIALFESLFETRITGIERNLSVLSASPDARITNISLLLDRLQHDVLGVRIPHVTAVGIVEGVEEDLMDLIEILGEIAVALEERRDREERKEVERNATDDGNIRNVPDDKGFVPFRYGEDIEKDYESDDDGFHPNISFSFDENAVYSDQPNQSTSTTSQSRSRTSGREYQQSTDDDSDYQEQEPSHSRSLSYQHGGHEKSRSKGKPRTKPLSEVTDDIELFEFLKEKELSEQRRVKGLQNAVAGRERKKGKHPLDSPQRVTGDLKRTRFNLKSTPSPKVHPLLRIEEGDTPHTRALKLRRARMMRELDETKKKTQRNIEVGLKNQNLLKNSMRTTGQIKQTSRPLSATSSVRTFSRSRQTTLPLRSRSRTSVAGSSFSSSRRTESRTRESERTTENDNDKSDSIENYDEGESDDIVNFDEEDIYSPPFNPPKTMAEDNFERFEERVESHLGIRKIPNAVKSRAWNGQIRDRMKALDSRLFERQVNTHKLVVDQGDIRPLKVLRKDMEKEINLKRKKADRTALHNATADLAEQRRRVNRMTARRQDAEKEVDSIFRRRMFREEQLAREAFTNYLSEQRSLVRDQSRFERDQQRAREKAEADRREAKERYQRDQIKLLEEKLAEAKREEEIVVKAQLQELRRLARERKDQAKSAVRRIKERLAVDENDFEMQRVAAEELRDSLRFGVVRQQR